MGDQLDKLKLERERVREEERALEEKYRYYLEAENEIGIRKFRESEFFRNWEFFDFLEQFRKFRIF